MWQCKVGEFCKGVYLPRGGFDINRTIPSRLLLLFSVGCLNFSCDACQRCLWRLLVVSAVYVVVVVVVVAVVWVGVITAVGIEVNVVVVDVVTVAVLSVLLCNSTATISRHVTHDVTCPNSTKPAHDTWHYVQQPARDTWRYAPIHGWTRDPFTSVFTEPHVSRMRWICIAKSMGAVVFLDPEVSRSLGLWRDVSVSSWKHDARPDGWTTENVRRVLPRGKMMSFGFPRTTSLDGCLYLFCWCLLTWMTPNTTLHFTA